jgi:SAM-dependent methyltransferase
MQSSATLSTGHQTQVPSEWVARFGAQVTPGGSILDVACGAGRHANWFAARGHPVDAVDRDLCPELLPHVLFQQADIESGKWPYAGRRFTAVVVTNYLHRPLMETLIDAVAPGGWLIYETFAAGNEAFGRPSRPEFLLQPGELLDLVRGRLRVVSYEDCVVEIPKPAMVQRIAARRTDQHPAE